MQTIGDAHSGRDASYYGERSEWFIAYSVTRDASILDESNWAEFVSRLQDVDGWAVERSGHWLVGWVDSLIVKPDSPAVAIVQEANKELKEYPILNEEDHSEREEAATCQLWEEMDMRERMRELCEHGDSLFAARESLASALYDRAYETYRRIQSLATE